MGSARRAVQGMSNDECPTNDEGPEQRLGNHIGGRCSVQGLRPGLLNAVPLGLKTSAKGRARPVRPRSMMRKRLSSEPQRGGLQ